MSNFFHIVNASQHAYWLTITIKYYCDWNICPVQQAIVQILELSLLTAMEVGIGT